MAQHYLAAIILEPNSWTTALAQLERHNVKVIKQWQQSTASQLWLDEPVLKAFVRQLAEQLPAKTVCRLALPATAVLSKRFALPLAKMSEAELAKTVNMLISKQFPLPPEQLLIDYGYQAEQLTIYAARRSELETIQQAFAQANLVLQRLTCQSQTESIESAAAQLDALLRQPLTYCPNFLPWRVWQQKRRRYWLLAMVTGLLLLTMALHRIYQQQLSQQRVQLEDELQQQQQQVQLLQVKQQQLQQLQQQLTESRQLLRQQQAQQQSQLQLLHYLQQLPDLLISPQLWLVQLNLQADHWQLQGEATQSKPVLALQQQLQHLPNVASVELQQLKLVQERFQFQLQIHFLPQTIDKEKHIAD